MEGKKVKSFSENGMQRFELCVFLINQERRNSRSRFDYESDIADRLFTNLPLRRDDDLKRLNRKNIFLYGIDGEIRRKDVVKRQLRGEM